MGKSSKFGAPPLLVCSGVPQTPSKAEVPNSDSTKFHSGLQQNLANEKESGSTRAFTDTGAKSPLWDVLLHSLLHFYPLAHLLAGLAQEKIPKGSPSRSKAGHPALAQSMAASKPCHFGCLCSPDRKAAIFSPSSVTFWNDAFSLRRTFFITKIGPQNIQTSPPIHNISPACFLFIYLFLVIILNPSGRRSINFHGIT